MLTRSIKQVWLCTVFIAHTPSTLHAITFVYNLRIGETTRTRNTSFGELKPSVGALTAIGQFREYETSFHQSAGGILGNYIYAQDEWYARINAAVGRVHADGCTIEQFGKTEFDDILFTGGYSWQIEPRTRISLSGHFGVPLHRDHIGNLVQLGTGHVGMGIQLDGLHALSATQAILVATRFIYFFPRDIFVSIAGKTECINNFHLGDIVDFLISYQHGFGKQRHMVAIGYNPTFTFDTDTISNPEKVGKAHTNTNSFFATYRYAFPIKDMLSALIVGLSYGFLNVPAPLNHGHSTTAWLTWGINF